MLCRISQIGDQQTPRGSTLSFPDNISVLFCGNKFVPEVDFNWGIDFELTWAGQGR